MSLTNWFHSVRALVGRAFSLPSRANAGKMPAPRATLHLEALEDRSVPTASFGSAFGITGSGTTGDGVATDGAGNVYMAGHFRGTRDFDPGPGVYSLTSAGNEDGYIAKYAADSSLLWAVSIGGVNLDNVLDVAVDAAGNVHICGRFDGSADFGTLTLTGTGGFAAKLDANGNFLWATALGGSNSAEALAIDGSGNVYVTGGQVAKLNAAGAVVWTVGLATPSTDIAIDSAGNVLVSGYFNGTVDFDPGPGTYNLYSGGRRAQPGFTAFVLKLNSAGGFIWADHFQAGTNSTNSWAFDLAVDANNNVYVTGDFGGTVDFDPGKGKFNVTTDGSADMFVVKLDAAGKLVWAKSLGGTGGIRQEWGDIALDAAGNIYLTAEFSGTVDFDPGSGVYNLTSVGSSDIFVTKWTSAGAFDWAVSAGSSDYEHGRAIAVDGSGNVYTTGAFSGTVDFDPGAGLAEVTGPGAFLWKLIQV